MSAVFVVQNKDGSWPEIPQPPLKINGFIEGTREADVSVIDQCIKKHESILLQGKRGRIIIEMGEPRVNEQNVNDAPLKLCFQEWNDEMFAMASEFEPAKELGDAIAKFDPDKACIATVITPTVAGRRTYVLSLPRSAKNCNAQKLNAKD